MVLRELGMRRGGGQGRRWKKEIHLPVPTLLSSMIELRDEANMHHEEPKKIPLPSSHPPQQHKKKEKISWDTIAHPARAHAWVL